jgi:hypothetical protein
MNSVISVDELCHQRIEEIEDISIYDGESRILTKYLFLSIIKVEDPIYNDIYNHPYTKAFQEKYGVYSEVQYESVIL